MEEDLKMKKKIKMEDEPKKNYDLKKYKWKTTSKKMEDNFLKK
jgi:hypothetical protein